MAAAFDEPGRISAVLGPTNTGKTHYAMERMLAHASGMIGFPLRLLARENYDRAVAAKGKEQVALITGEEKILPKDARWFLCTVESMPVDREFAFVGIDEIQMSADPDRGHIFTDRLLHARGRSETMFMGAETIRPLLKRLVPDAEIVTRPRFSVLTHVGPAKINRLPARSAIVSFTASNVYAIAELIRRQRGGAAVVLGALSPRTRNAQVEMYQTGEVDYLVATDAIGMGLNMDVDHVAFAALKKFDGRRIRHLTAPELAQAAGRAGRHMNDGTFGTTAEAGTLSDEIAERIEEHRFDALEHIYWRNTDLDLSSLAALRSSLNQRPTVAGLTRTRAADDELIFDRLRKEPDVVSTAKGKKRVQLLWDVCQIPDFRGVMSDAHANLAMSIYKHLTSGAERLAPDWVAANVKRLDRTDGDIDTLIGRIAGIRTWTYVSFRNDWVLDAEHWQQRTRAIEDRLSDALHERLTHRFVDRKTSVLINKLKDNPDLTAAVRANGEVLIEGEPVGRLEGLRFYFDRQIEGDAGRAVANAAHRAVRTEVARKARIVASSGDKDFAVETSEQGRIPRIMWQNTEIARLINGKSMLRPGIAVIGDDLLDAHERTRVERRIQSWLEGRIERVFQDLFKMQSGELKGAARGLGFQLLEGLGSLRRGDASEQIDALNKADRKQLRDLGVRIGRDMAYMPALLKPDAIYWRALLWSLHRGYRDIPDLPAPGRVSIPINKRDNLDFLEACGYRPLGPLAVRIDMAERLTSKAWLTAKKGPFAPTPDLLSMIGATLDDFPGVMRAIGFKRIQKKTEDGTPEDRYRPMRAKERNHPPQKRRKRPAKAAPAPDPHSPFAKLKDLSIGG
ncbi:MAG: disulfide oxidoreductase [Rhodospirillales bacterium]|nr:disulfide oxidoreductase [Rhodospirillales bacterium]